AGATLAAPRAGSEVGSVDRRARAPAPQRHDPRARLVRRRSGILLANIVVFAALVVCAEAIARVASPRRIDAVFCDPQVFIRQRPFIVPHPTRGFALRAGYDQGPYRINAAGFRGAELPTSTGNRALLLAMGESSTFGWGVGNDATYPAHLQEDLSARYP